MLSRVTRTVAQISRTGCQNRILEFRSDFYGVPYRSYAKVAPTPTTMNFTEEGTANSSNSSPVNLDKLFWSKPSSLALALDSPFRIEEPQYEGIRRFILKMLLFYSKQSKDIRGANVVYKCIVAQADKPAIYDVFNLEKTFKTNFSLLVLHAWLCLRRLKEEGEEGVDFGQYIYEIYNHDVELRVSNAGVNFLLAKWMKDLEKIFYGNVIAYNKAILPEAGKDDLPNVLWRNIFAVDGAPVTDAAAKRASQAMARYVRLQNSCLLLTDREALFSGNFMFTPLDKPTA